MTLDVFQSIGTKETLVERVVNQLEELIIGKHLEPGTKLPPERELADQLGVSRTALREAMHILTTKGLLESRHGVGTMVRQITVEQVAEPLHMLLRSHTGGNNISFGQLHQVRTILEVEIAALAAEQATEADIARLRQNLAQMEIAQADLATLALHDADFHRSLVAMTRNPLLEILLDSIRDLLSDYIKTVTPYLDARQDVLPPHYAVVEAIAAKDPERARLAMQRHQAQMRRNHEKYLKLASLGSDK